MTYVLTQTNKYDIVFLVKYWRFVGTCPTAVFSQELLKLIKMKKLLFSLYLLFFAIISFAQKPFSQVFQETVELNKTRFEDVNLIQPGDTVLLPNKTGIGTEAWVADYPIYLEGVKRHDCMWRITERYMDSELITFPVDTVKVVVPAPAPEEEKADWRWLWWLLLLIPIIALILYLLWRQRTVLDRGQVIPGGLSDNAAAAATQIQAISPGARIARVERGRITGDRRRRIMVMFNNGPRLISLEPGQSAYRVTELNGNITYYLQHCGNLAGVIANGRFVLPEGWTFVPDAEANTVWERQSTENQEVVTKEEKQTPPTPAPVPAEIIPVPVSDIVSAIKAIGEVTAPVSKMTIKNGELDITVEFDQKK